MRLAAPRCGGSGPHSLALGPGARGNTNTLHAVVRCLAACLGRNARPGCIAGLYGRLTVADPCFQGSGEAVESLLSHATGHDPGRRPCPRIARYAHRASHRQGTGRLAWGERTGISLGEFFWLAGVFRRSAGTFATSVCGGQPDVQGEAADVCLVPLPEVAMPVEEPSTASNSDIADSVLESPLIAEKRRSPSGTVPPRFTTTPNPVKFANLSKT